MTRPSLRELLAEASEQRRRGDIALAEYLEMYTAAAVANAFFPRRSA